MPHEAKLICKMTSIRNRGVGRFKVEQSRCNELSVAVEIDEADPAAIALSYGNA